MRAVGGLLYLIGFFMFAYNIYMTITSSKSIDKETANASPMAS
jgi:cytochrome c oxidase cbb3-type subunit 1